MKNWRGGCCFARDGRIYFHQEQEQERERPVEEIAVFANDLDLIFEFEKNMRHIKLMVVMMNIDDDD